MLLKKLRNIFTKEQPTEMTQDGILTFINNEQRNTETHKEETAITNLIQKLRKQLETLKQTKPKKDVNVPKHVLNKVNDSRKAYIQMVETLCKKAEKYDNDFINFSQRSSKPFYTTQYLYGETLDPVRHTLKELEAQLKTYEVKKEQEALNQEMKKRITEHLTKDKEQEIKEIEKQMQEVYPGDIKHEIQIIETSEELYQHNKKREEVKQQIENIREQILEIISPLKRAIRKYNNVHKDQLLMKYEEETIEALREDKNTEIVEKIQKINLNAFENDAQRVLTMREAIKEVPKLHDLRKALLISEETYEKIKEETAIERDMKKKQRLYDEYTKKYAELQKQKEAKENEPEVTHEELERMIQQITGKKVRIIER